MDKNVENTLHKLYYEPPSPAAFTGVRSLHREAAKKYPTLKKENVKEWLLKQTIYSLHKQRRKLFKRNKVFAMRIDECWECDLVDMRQ